MGFYSKESPILEVRDLTKVYGETCEFCRDKNNMLNTNRCTKCGTIWACRDVNLEVYTGEILGIVGESGSGKSTLMKCLYFDQEVTSGSAHIGEYENGETNIFDVNSQQRRNIRNYKMGMVYQNPLLGLRMNYSAVGNIAEKLLAAGCRNVDKMTARAKELLEHVEINTERMIEPPKNFSGGMQQRVQISKALANNPPILLLDEVTTGLDLSVQARVLDLIKSLQHELQIAMLVVSHDLGVVNMLSDRTMVMYQGRVIESGLTDQILEDPQDKYTQLLVSSMI